MILTATTRLALLEFFFSCFAVNTAYPEVGMKQKIHFSRSLFRPKYKRYEMSNVMDLRGSVNVRNFCDIAKR